MRQLLTTSVLVLTLWGCARPAAPAPSEQLPPAETPPHVEPLQPIEPVVMVPSITPARETPPPQVRASLSVPSSERRLRIKDTAELTLRARIEHLQDQAQLSLLLESPQGNAYAVGAWLLEGDGTLLERDLTVPVRNTAIETQGLTGDWKAKLSLDGQPVDALVLEME